MNGNLKRKKGNEAVKFTEVEAEILTWAIDGHNTAVDDPDYHEDNPEEVGIQIGSDPASWAVIDIEDVLYRLEAQADGMDGDPETNRFARKARLVGRKLRACRPDGNELGAI